MLNTILTKFWQECEGDPEAKKGNNADMLAKCRAGLVDYQVAVSQNVEKFSEGITIAEKSSFFIINECLWNVILQANVKSIDVCKFATDMIVEHQFKNGE